MVGAIRMVYRAQIRRQVVIWPSATSMGSGLVCAHFSVPIGRRVGKRQPEGGRRIGQISPQNGSLPLGLDVGVWKGYSRRQLLTVGVDGVV